MAKETLYWVDPSSNFGGGETPIKFGEEMPESFKSDPRFESFKKEGKVSTEKAVTVRQLSELEQLREKVKELGKGGGADPKAVQTALETSVQSDLDRIAELEEGDAGELQDKIDLVVIALGEINPTDNRPVVDSKLEEIKILLTKGE